MCGNKKIILSILVMALLTLFGTGCDSTDYGNFGSSDLDTNSRSQPNDKNNEDLTDSNEAPSIEYCGTILDTTPKSGPIHSGHGIVIRVSDGGDLISTGIPERQFKDIHLLANNDEVEKKLAQIEIGQRYLGCVYGSKKPQQGFEGVYFWVDRIKFILDE